MTRKKTTSASGKKREGIFFPAFSAPDVQLLLPVLILVGLGVVMVFSASGTVSLEVKGSGYYYLKRQALFAVLGLGLLMGFRCIPYRFYKSLAYGILLFGIFLLVAVLIPGIGRKVGGATRWIDLGPFSVQAAEPARLALVIFFAYSLSKKEPLVQRFSVGFAPHFAVLVVFAVLLLMQPDFGSMVIISALTWTILFYGGVRLRHLLWPLLPVLPGLYYLMTVESYRMGRLISFMNPWAYEATNGYQLVHSQMAFGTGGLWGVGIGKGYQKLFYLPEAHTDFIFAVIGEELGFIRGVLPILLIFLWLIWRGVIIARRAPDRFGSILALGLTAGLGFQVCINLAVTLGLLPTKGLPLPFLSYGGSSLLVCMSTMGMLMNIAASRQS